MKQCPFCGAQLSDDAPYCHVCGNHIEGDATNYSPIAGESTVMLPQQQQQQSAAMPPQYVPAPTGYSNVPQTVPQPMPQQYPAAPAQKKSHFGLIITLASIAAFLLGLLVVLGILYYSNKNDNAETESTEASVVTATHDAPTTAPASPGTIDQSYIESEANRLGLQYNTVTAADLAGKSNRELRLLRNYIFAKHSYRFKDPELMSFFSQYPWYEPVYSNVSSMLSTTEQRNVQTIKRLE